MSNYTIFRASKVITMNPRRPAATHVAVRDGLILGTGNLQDLTGWGDYTLDDSFDSKIIMPGFIEGHSHSWEGSAWQDTYVGYLDRTAPDRIIHNGLKSIDEVIRRLQQAEQNLANSSEALRGWGMDPLFFDRRMNCADLDRVSTTRAVVIVHQSGHIINVNSYMLEKAGINADTDVDGLLRDDNGQPTGELLGIALYQSVLHASGMNTVLDMGNNPTESLWRFANSARIAGVTTATDLANEMNPEMLSAMKALSLRDDYPLRVVPAFIAQMKPAAESLQHILSVLSEQNPKLRIGLIKLILDGSIQGFTARLKAPGYFNGTRNGLWYIDPDELPKILATFHQHGLQIHVHTNGDEATESAIDAMEEVLCKHPNADARFTLQHCQLAHDAHFRRMAKLGICANLFSNHIYYWGDQHYDITLGPERAERMDAAGTAGRLGVNYAIHSDAPVTHLAPLFTAWCAVNRKTQSGRVLGEHERITVADALHAITLGAAYTLKLDTELGSIETGKRADFTILDEDPLSVDPAELKDIPVWGTVLDGHVFPVSDI